MSRVTLGPFSIDVPSEWTLTTVILAGPPDHQPPPRNILGARSVSPFQRNLVATMEAVADGETTESYLRRQIEGLRQAGVYRRDAREPEKIKLHGGGEGLVTESVIQGSNGELVRQMQMVRIKNGVAYTVIASHLEGPAFEAAREEFRNMILSFS